MSAAGKLRTPTKADMENAERWLNAAKYNLSIKEYHRVKLLCKQVIRALRRKETEGHNAKSEPPAPLLAQVGSTDGLEV
jgi:hypothetical protein